MNVIEELRQDSPSDDKEALLLVKASRLKRYQTNTIMPILQLKSLFGVADKFKLQRQINPAAQYQYAFVMLDTSNIDTNLSTDTKYSWKVVNYPTQERGTITVANSTRDLVGMRIFPMTTVLTAPIKEPGKVNYTNPVVNLNHNFTILIHEFQAQSYVGRDGRKFHFVLFPQLMNPAQPEKGPPYTPATPYLEFVTSGKMNGWFWFRTPITEFSTMTVSMGNPFDLLTLSQTTRTLIPILLVFLAEKKEAN